MQLAAWAGGTGRLVLPGPIRSGRSLAPREMLVYGPATMGDPKYKVVRQLDEVMPQAATPQKAGVSFDLRLYFRENDEGYQWAEVAFLDRDNSHRIIDQMPLVGDGVV